MTALDVARPPSVPLPNSMEAIRSRVAGGAIAAGTVWRMLAFRPLLALGMQCLFALGFAIAGSVEPWREAADWWLFSFAVGEFVNLWLLRRLAQGEGIRLRDLYNPGGRATRNGDLKWAALALVVAGPIGYLPNLLIGGWLWGDAQVGADLSFRAMPLLAAWLVLLVFPVIHAATELPTYFGYVMPRLQALTGSRRTGLIAAAGVLSLQHVFLPLLFDWRFVVWRMFMFLAFAFWMGWVIDRRPTTLPYLAVAHGLIDMTLPLFVLFASMP
jgi:hypothetical protein